MCYCSFYHAFQPQHHHCNLTTLMKAITQSLKAFHNTNQQSPTMPFWRLFACALKASNTPPPPARFCTLLVDPPPPLLRAHYMDGPLEILTISEFNIVLVTWHASCASSPPAQKLEAGRMKIFSVTALIFRTHWLSFTIGTSASRTRRGMGPAVKRYQVTYLIKFIFGLVDLPPNNVDSTRVT